MKTVLAAIDNSTAARPVLAVGEAVARLFGARLEAVHVREDHGRTAANAAGAAGVPLRTIESETVVEGLVAAARERGVAAVVLGARGARTGRRPAGHVALELAVSTRRPTVVVPPTATVPCRLERLLVPLNGTADTTHALERAVAIATHGGIEIVVLHVHDAGSLPPFADQPQHELDAWAAEFLARYLPTPESAPIEVRVGNPGEHVVDVAAEVEAGMIALGWAQELAPGRAAVVREALARSPVPVLLVPVSSAAAADRSAIEAAAVHG